MKKQKNYNIKNKVILPLAAVFSVSSIALTSLINVTQNVNNNFVDSLTNSVSSNSKSISSNINQKNNLVGPHELFYLSQKLNSSINVWNDRNNQEDTTNSNYWSNFKNNIESVSGSSSIKDELVTIASQALNVKSIKSIYKQFDELKQQNTWMTDQMIQSLKDTIKSQTGYVESMSEIVGIDDIPSKLLSLSGIEEGTKISTLTTVGNANMLTTDLSTTSTGVSGNIGTVAGTDFTYLAKIAEIDPTVEGSYALTFNWKKTASSSTISGTLFINNKSENGSLPLQTQRDNITNLSSSLDVFGRWSLGSNGTLGTGNYEQEFKNFVIQKGTSDNGQEVIEVLVRLKDNQSISNIQWGTDITVPGALDLKQGLKFGILDVQANDKNTFKSAILGTFSNNRDDSSSYPTSGKLIDSIDNVINKVSFFSDTLSSKKITTRETAANRNLTFWQYGNLDLSLPLYYAVASESDIDNNTITYNPISIYSNGSATSAQQTIILNSTESEATTISPNTYSMFSELKSQLPENVINDFVSASTITLTSSLYSTQKVTKQELKFYDNFYAIGNRDEGWNSVDISGDIKFIKIQDPTQKIFFENPFPDNITIKADPTVLTTTVSAQETIDERTAVIGFLGNIYEQFSKSDSGDLTGENYSNLIYGKWTPKGANNSNIVYESATFNGSPNQLYLLLNNTWRSIRPAMDTLFGITTKDNRYDVSGQSAQTIVTSYLAFISEFTADSSKLELLITEAITKVKEEITNITETTEYASLSSDLKKSLGQIMAKLIQLQLDTISNEFQLRLSTPLYNAIKNIILNDQNKVSFTINDPTSFLEVISTSTSDKKLIKYSNNGWNNIISNTESSLSDAITKMLQILYFNNANDNMTVYLGNSIFNTGNLETLFNSYSANSLTSFISDTYQTQSEKVEFYGKLLSIFTNYNLQNKVQEMLRTGTATTINESEIITAFKDMLLKITNQIQRTESVQEDVVTSYYLDDLISGANAIITLKWKLEQLSTSFNTRAVISQSDINNIQQNIQNILNSNEQISSSELSIWSNIILGSSNYSSYTENLSGRNGDANLISMADKIADDNTLLTPRAQETIPAIIVLEYLIKYIWWPILALIGLGIVVSSSVGLATKDRKVKLSARPVIKWLLVASIILGLGVITLSILLGLPVLGLPTIL